METKEIRATLEAIDAVVELEEKSGELDSANRLKIFQHTSEIKVLLSKELKRDTESLTSEWKGH